MKHWLRALRFFRQDAPQIVLVLLLLVGSTVANLLKPWPLAIIVDSVFGEKPPPAWLGSWTARVTDGRLLILATIAVLVLHFGHGALSAWHNYLSIKIGLCGLRRVRDELFSRLQRLSLRFHQGTKIGDLIYRAAWDTYAFQTFFQQGLVTLFTATLSLTLMVAIMWQLNVLLTLVALGIIPLVLVSIRLFGREMRARGTAAQQADSQVTSLVQQTIVALPLIQAYSREEHEEQAFAQQTTAAQEKRLSQHGWELLYWLGISVVFGAGAAAIIWVGADQVLAFKLTIGELLIFVAYLAQLYEPLNQLSHVGATVSSASAGTQRVYEVLDAPDEVRDAPDARPVKGVEGSIAFENVCFSYNPGQPVLRDASFKIAPGESLAILGPSGAGKSTLLSLIPRLFDPSSGRVALDGADLRELRLRDLRSCMALVMQEPLLLPGTVADNIAYGRPGASLDEIVAAAIAAHADPFIQRLPQQYMTLMGEGAARLSVGEKQRLNLARAFLRDAPILVLDEPTSALDAEGEALVLESLLRLMKDRTTLMVAHRLATVERMDKVLVLDCGRVTEFGTPAELAVIGGYYSRVLNLAMSH
ncbi:MAG: ABC transporter ATP-binding protein/permease [Verrucomicrobia subdivision 3 bacterium]|nr:ABC transporter ATP-binding protein/permease [Limisphaerales bacterium]